MASDDSGIDQIEQAQGGQRRVAPCPRQSLVLWRARSDATILRDSCRRSHAGAPGRCRRCHGRPQHRVQRLAKKMSQSALADAIGISFQQVQKYEKGVNRVGAGRLVKIAAALDLPVMTLLDGIPGAGRKRETPAALALIKAFAAIDDKDVRRADEPGRGDRPAGAAAGRRAWSAATASRGGVARARKGHPTATLVSLAVADPSDRRLTSRTAAEGCLCLPLQGRVKQSGGGSAPSVGRGLPNAGEAKSLPISTPSTPLNLPPPRGD